MFRLISISAIIVASVAAAACGKDSTPVQPVEPPVQVDETFSDTLNVHGAITHTFFTDRAGQVVATLQSLSPDSAAIVSFLMGTWNGQYCQVTAGTLVKDDATTGANLVGNASAGAFCVRIADIGKLTEPTTYSIKVSHY
jgi:hypothetical protein